MRERERRSEQVGEKRRALASKRQRERERDRLKRERRREGNRGAFHVTTIINGYIPTSSQWNDPYEAMDTKGGGEGKETTSEEHLNKRREYTSFL